MEANNINVYYRGLDNGKAAINWIESDGLIFRPAFEEEERRSVWTYYGIFNRRTDEYLGQLNIAGGKRGVMQMSLFDIKDKKMQGLYRDCIETILIIARSLTLDESVRCSGMNIQLVTFSTNNPKLIVELKNIFHSNLAGCPKWVFGCATKRLSGILNFTQK